MKDNRLGIKDQVQHALRLRERERKRDACHGEVISLNLVRRVVPELHGAVSVFQQFPGPTDKASKNLPHSSRARACTKLTEQRCVPARQPASHHPTVHLESAMPACSAVTLTKFFPATSPLDMIPILKMKSFSRAVATTPGFFSRGNLFSSSRMSAAASSRLVLPWA